MTDIALLFDKYAENEIVTVPNKSVAYIGSLKCNNTLKIEIMNRRTIEEKSRVPFSARTVVISCSDYGADRVCLKNSPDYLLNLEFDDVSL